VNFDADSIHISDFKTDNFRQIFVAIRESRNVAKNWQIRQWKMRKK